MNIVDAEKRKRIMSRSISLGHCVCDPAKDCPCREFKDKNICECAGERDEIVTGQIRLTDHVRAVGCASKVPKKYLQDVMANLSGFKDNRVLIGYEGSDDAGILQIAGNAQASILTVDVFAPSVDDPYTFGMIAAANSISDIYAMGGKAESALSIIGFPIHTLPESAMSAMLQGGADKLAEAEVAVIGGHSINDSEIKCGYAVLGSVDRDGIIANSGAKLDDVLILTKPIGGGIVLFGKQLNMASEEELAEVTGAMTTLNKIAGEAMNAFKVNAATDVTGFSLLGHLAEMAAGSKKEIEVDFSRVPLFSGVLRLAEADAFPGAVERNREASESYLNHNDLTPAEQNILFSPETSGGLLVSIPESNAKCYMEYLAKNGIAAVIIGRIKSESKTGSISLIGSQGVASTKKTGVEALTQQTATACCCSPAPAQNPPDIDSCCSKTVDQEPQASCCSSSQKVSDESRLPQPSASEEFGAYMKGVNAAGAIAAKEKKLIALALSVSHKCGECVIQTISSARKLGATDAEISEAVALGIAFGGASANMFYNELIK